MLIKKIFFIFLIGIFFVFGSAKAFGAQTHSSVNLNVYYCNHNTVCEAELGEDYIGCSDDCEAPICNNNNICDGVEDINNCPADCTPAPTTTTPVSGGGGGGGGYSGVTVTTTNTSTTSTVVVATSTTNTSTVVVTNTIGVPSNSAPLANPFFSATGLDGQILLRWKKTDQSIWKKVVIRRSTLFYPENMDSGGLLFEGVGNTADNKNFYIYDLKLKNGKRYFYTLFVVDINGHHSTGATASALPEAAATVSSTLEIPGQEIPPETTLPKSPNFIELNPDGFTFIDPMLEIPWKNIPPETFSGILTIQEPNGYKTYILGQNSNGMFTVLPSLGGLERNVVITFLDHNHQILSQMSGKINSKIIATAVSPLRQAIILFKSIIALAVSSWKVWVSLAVITAAFLLRFL